MASEESNLIYPPKPAPAHVTRVTTEVMIAFIRAFDGLNGLKSGSVYIINGKEVKV